MGDKINTTPPWPCSFCGKMAEEVGILVVGPEHICICDECVELCAMIICAKRAEKRKEIDKIDKGKKG